MWSSIPSLTGLNERKDSIYLDRSCPDEWNEDRDGEQFHRLIKPESAFKPKSVIIHGITPSDVVQKPNIDAILAEFLEFCDD